MIKDDDKTYQETITKWRKAVKKFMPAINPDYYKQDEVHKNIDHFVDYARLRISQDEYLQEVSTGKQSDNHILKMTKLELEACQLNYDKSSRCFVDNLENKASTIGKTSKEEDDAQVFIMSKDGLIYIATHNMKIRGEVLVHGSFLHDIPVEMAGLIKISNGKIYWISNNSGHYTPDETDMYRGISRLKQKYPGVFTQDAQISMVDGAEELLSDFIKGMEEIQTNGKNKYYDLREGRKKYLKEENSYLDTPFCLEVEEKYIKDASIVSKELAQLSSIQKKQLYKAISNNNLGYIKIKERIDPNLVARNENDIKIMIAPFTEIVDAILYADNPRALKVLIDGNITKRKDFNSNQVLSKVVGNYPKNSEILDVLINNQSIRERIDLSVLEKVTKTNNPDLVSKILSIPEMKKLFCEQKEVDQNIVEKMLYSSNNSNSICNLQNINKNTNRFKVQKVISR